MTLTDSDSDAFPSGNSSGVTKREYFAAMAMQGLCANSIPGNQHLPDNLSREAVCYADALIAELNKSQVVQ